MSKKLANFLFAPHPSIPEGHGLCDLCNQTSPFSDKWVWANPFSGCPPCAKKLARNKRRRELYRERKLATNEVSENSK
jgi:hypothetical protein